MTVYSPVLDNGLNLLHNTATSIYLCISEPPTYNDAVNTLALGNRNFGAGATCSAPDDALPNGRVVTSPQISDGQIINTGNATGWAIVDNVNQVLLASGVLSSSMSLHTGNTFSLSPFSITFPSY